MFPKPILEQKDKEGIQAGKGCFIAENLKRAGEEKERHIRYNFKNIDHTQTVEIFLI